MKRQAEELALPHNLEAEQRLLGGIFINNRSLEKVSSFLQSEHFYEPLHGRIYASCVLLIDRGQLANPVTLKNLFQEDPAMIAVGGWEYMARLTNSAVSVDYADNYGKIIFELARRRALIDAGQLLIAEAWSQSVDEDSEAQLNRHLGRLEAIAERGDDEGFVPLKKALHGQVQIVDDARKRGGNITGITSGFRDVDELLGGFQPGDLIILGGRPSMGKTTLCVDMGLRAAAAALREGDKPEYAIGFCSLEMTSTQIASMALARETKISADAQRKAKVSDAELASLMMEARRMAALPFYIDKSRGIGLRHIRTHARALKRKHNLRLLKIDYLQLLRADVARRIENRVQDLADITRGLKEIADELGITIVALSQLSRDVEKRDDKRPQLSDLRDSGAIEQDADIVLFVYRHEYYLRNEKPRQTGSVDKYKNALAEWDLAMSLCADKAELIVGKNRLGPSNETVHLLFNRSSSKFDDLPAPGSGREGEFNL